LAAQQEAKMDRILIANVKITNEGLSARGGANEKGTPKMQFLWHCRNHSIDKRDASYSTAASYSKPKPNARKSSSCFTFKF
jgi:hypothetical protein